MGKKIITGVIFVIALAMFLFSGFSLLKAFREYKKGDDEYSSLETYVTRETDGQEVTIDETESEFVYETESDVVTGHTIKKRLYSKKSIVDFDSLKKINSDLVGWLLIDSLGISYPVVQTDNNDYYLHKTFEKKDNFAGCLFIEYQNHSDFSDNNTIIYGHNMKNGSMFGKLRKILEDGVYSKDPYFWIYTEEKVYKFHVFSARTVNVDSESYTLQFATPEDFQNYLNDVSGKSELKCDQVSVDANDKIVTLSTCTGDESTRFVIQGKLVRTYKTVR
ncbi:MAG: class B sortase [Blautia sp.]